jgi:predicted hydrocarbon binding protein
MKPKEERMREANGGDATYTFTWDDIGNIELGRPNLGQTASVMAYRLLQYTFKEVLHKTVGGKQASDLFVRAGHLAGTHFCQNILDCKLDFDAFIADLERQLVNHKIGILRIEHADLDAMKFTLTVSEDLDCSGLPVHGETVCDYDEGFIAGILECYTGKPFSVKEVDCWATGDRTCRFEVSLAEGNMA